jgi:hypothetical protein
MSLITSFAFVIFLVLCISVFRRWRRKSGYTHIPGPTPSTMLGRVRSLFMCISAEYPALLPSRRHRIP